jgi:nitroreductase
MDAIEALKTRRSVRAYTAEPVPRQIIEDLIDCGRLATSARNVQPWEFVVVTGAAALRWLGETANTGSFIANAAACIAVFCRDTKYFLEDGSAATQNILLAARAHGLGACWVAGDKKPYAQDVSTRLGVPQGCRLISLIALGYPAEDPQKAKRPLAEILHWEKF